MPFIDWIDDQATNISDYRFKMTIAPQISLGRHSEPPRAAIVLTYAYWRDAFVGKVGGPITRPPMRVGPGPFRRKAGGKPKIATASRSRSVPDHEVERHFPQQVPDTSA